MKLEQIDDSNIFYTNIVFGKLQVEKIVIAEDDNDVRDVIGDNFQASYYPNEKFDIKTSEGFTVVCSNSNALEELQKIFKKINIHSAYFYDRVNEDKYDFFSNEFPIFLKQNFEKEILNEKLSYQTTITKKFKL
jgi:hypothetical protein